MDWNPPAVLPLNLRSHLGKFGIGDEDLVVIEGLPEGADMTVGMCKPDGSWSMRAVDIDSAAFIPLYENGETYELKVCLLTPDASDHGLPKMKGKVQFSLAVPLAPLPVLEAFEDLAPQKNGITPDTVILLPADPTLKEGSDAQPKVAAAPISPLPERAADAPTSAERAHAAAADLDKYFAALRTDWQANVQNQIAAAEQRLKAGHLQQLSKIQTVLGQGEAERTTAVAAKWKAELDRRAADAETGLKARVKKHLADLASRLHGESGGDVAAADLEERLALARQQWQAEEAERLASAEAQWRAEAHKQRAALEAQHGALHEVRMAAAETAWRKGETERLAAAELAWSKREAERLAAMEAKWRAEHEMRLGTVLANLETMARGQLDLSQPLPAIEPAPAASATHDASPEAGDDDTRWNNTAAA